MVFGKTTIMRILQNLLNFNFAELIKYDFESIDIEVFAKNGKILKEKLVYSDLLPTDEEIKKMMIDSPLFFNDLSNEWDLYKDFVPDDEKISSFDDCSMSDEEKIDIWNDFDFDIAYDYCEAGEFDVLTNELLKDLIKRNELKNIIRKIIKKEEFNNLYYDDYINKLHYNNEHHYYLFNLHHNHTCWQYDDVKNTLKKMIDIIKEFLEHRLTSTKEINFANKKNITRMINMIKDNISKTVDILDMTKVYNFGNNLLTSSLITNQLLEWKAALPNCSYASFARTLEKDVYKTIYKAILEDEFGYEEEDFENKSKDISELNNTNTIEINSIINHYFYNEDFVLAINIKALEYYINYNDAEKMMYTQKSMVEDKTQVKDKFNRYVRPIILKNSPFDDEFYAFNNVNDKMFCDFCTKEWHLFEEHINPKILTLQKLLNKYMMNKEIEVTPMGLLVKSKEDNRKIPLNSLSSGEKKLIVIFMHCLFNEDVPIIIDEPEISLSIIWQENLLPDLLEQTNIKQVIVATHSSAIISNSVLDKYIVPLPNSIVEQGGKEQ